MQIHLIAIGGALMHSLAISLQNSGHMVSGSDDEIYEPALSRLKANGLLPATGWQPSKIHSGLHMVILGMHARANNPELAKAQQIGVKIVSYPEFLYEMSKDKLRIVVAGSHGKTSTTAAIMQLLAVAGLRFDYAVGAKLSNFDNMVSLSDAPIIVIEGDEYLSSTLDKQAKFLHYQPNILVLTGISWDHINVFPSFAAYLQPFAQLLASLEASNRLFYYEKDPVIQQLLANVNKTKIAVQSYTGFDYYINSEQKTVARVENSEIELQVFGQHNLQNLQAAYLVGQSLGISQTDLIAGLGSFVAASQRLEKIYNSADNNYLLFKDFAHSPSKVRATVAAVRQQFANYRLVVAYELYTFSSFNPQFLREYSDSLNMADVAYLYYNPATLQQKQPKTDKVEFSTEFLRACFNQNDLQIEREIAPLWQKLKTESQKRPVVLLLMSSGHWDKANLNELGAG